MDIKIILCLPDISKAFLMAPLLSSFLTQIPLKGSAPLKKKHKYNYN